MAQKAVQFKVVLNNTKPEVWRRLQILEAASLRSLHYAIQDVFWWKGYHSYFFKINNDEYSDPEFDTECVGWLDDSKIKVGTIANTFPEFEFIYDFGDWWSHKIVFEKFVDADEKEKYPVCLAGENSAPPEDCGGPHGFQEFKEAVKNRKHERHQELMEWFAETNFNCEFTVDKFDLDLTNFRIGRRQKPRTSKSVAKVTESEK